MILKVAEFLEGDDLLRMRLSQAILATLSDPKHDFLWAKPCRRRQLPSTAVGGVPGARCEVDGIPLLLRDVFGLAWRVPGH